MLASFTTVEQELKTLLKGECFFDSTTRANYSTASSWYKITPIGVVFPRDIDDVQAVARVCHESEIPLIARGAGTGLAGQAVGLGIILDFSKHMNNVLHCTGNDAQVQPGVVLNDLNQQLAPSGMFFPVDPASGSLCTLGGMISTNAAGAHGLKYGATKDHIESLDVVLSNGELARINSEIPDSDDFPTLSEIYANLERIIRPHQNVIRERFPRVAKNSSGYNLVETIADGRLDLRRLLAGSEGTLALVVGANLKLSPIPRHRIGALACFSDYEPTVEATVKALELSPSAIEILDHTYFSLAPRHGGPLDAFLRDDAQTMLYFEFEGDHPEELQHTMSRLKNLLEPFNPLNVALLQSENERTSFWNLREDVSKQLNLGDTFGKTSFIEDTAVPIAHLPAFFRGLKRILSAYGIRFSAYGHAGAGNIHCATFVDITDPDQYRSIDLVATEVNELAISLEGTLSGEHGDGFVRTPFLERLYGEEVYHVFKEVKRIFDPGNILNPGKIIGKQNTTILHDLALA